MSQSILRIKRTANQISTQDDIVETDDQYLNLARQIFFHYYNDQYNNLDLSIYQTGSYSHPVHQDISVTPHFIRDDGVIVYLQLVQSRRNLYSISEEIIQLTMEILGLKNTLVCTIFLERGFRNKPTTSCYSAVQEKSYRYSPEIAKEYLATLVHKKPKLSSDPIKITKQTVRADTFHPNEWVSASKTRNYALKDTLVDWLDYWQDKQTGTRVHQSSAPTNEYDFSKFLLNKGLSFESHVIELIKGKTQPEDFVTICSNMNHFHERVLEYEKTTIDAIQKGIPFIYQAVLLNHEGKLAYSYGMPDLLVRSDYLSQLVTTNPLNSEMQTYKAPNLTGNYHYVVVDIKYTTLELCTDGKRIRNAGMIPAFKCQLYVYNHALGYIQGYEPPSSFILGRRYKYESKKILYSGNNCFDRLGHIEYNDWDARYVDETITAIGWIRKLRTEGKEWVLLPSPSVPQLYPNMCNPYETPWDNFKAQYAKDIGEITLLWNCGVKNREIAHRNGIYSYRDPECTAKLLGICGPKQGPVLNAIICINRQQNFQTAMDRIQMHINKDIDNEWMENSKLRIVVDFEIVNCVFDEFSTLPVAYEHNYLFLIGVGSKFKTEPIQYNYFLAANLSAEAELQMVQQFYEFLRSTTDKFLGKSKPIPPLYHWGHIERSFFNNLCIKLKRVPGFNNQNNQLDSINTELVWFDLLECFKENPIVVNGCFKFGLKEIAKRLFDLGLIKITWNHCTNGNTVMVMAYNAYKNSKIPINQNPTMQDIIAYNRIDCEVVHEIIGLLQAKIQN